MSAVSAPEVRYAGFWIRLAAALIDSVLITVIILPLLYWVYGVEYFRPDAPFIKGAADVLLNYVLPLAAAVVFWFYRAATPGKMLLSLRIVDARTLGKLSLQQCLVRSLAYLVSILPLGLGFVWIARDARKQGWHDKLAGTVVVYSQR
jgi:uncharacterized RDD family membrane protein YckC